ncbi:MAG TPA: phosphotransferase [Acidimicrobiales bacterium]|nr:phosphotransferase [Acidimicrobiales bacterium]
MTTNGHQGNALAELRARTALRAAGLDPRAPLARASSVTNEVWMTDTHVVRVNRGHNNRLAREAAIAAVLPAAVGYPTIRAHGGRAGEDWLVLDRVPGVPLAHCWPELTPLERHQAVSQLATRLRALHDTTAPAGLPPVHGTPQLLEVNVEHPTASLLAAIEALARLDHVDPLLAQEAAELVQGTATALDPFVSPTLVHGDLTFENVLWHEGEVTAVLDVEWARPGPRDIDLDIILRCCAYPQLHVAPGFEAATRTEDYVDVPDWLREVYPRLFAYPRLAERLRIFAIAYEVRELLAFPPTVPAAQQDPRSAYHRLRRVVQRDSYLD